MVHVMAKKLCCYIIYNTLYGDEEDLRHDHPRDGKKKTQRLLYFSNLFVVWRGRDLHERLLVPQRDNTEEKKQRGSAKQLYEIL